MHTDTQAGTNRLENKNIETKHCISTFVLVHTAADGYETIAVFIHAFLVLCSLLFIDTVPRSFANGCQRRWHARLQHMKKKNSVDVGFVLPTYKERSCERNEVAASSY